MTLPTAGELSVLAREAAARSGVKERQLTGTVPVTSPVNGAQVAAVDWATAADVDAAVGRAQEAFLVWRATPAPCMVRSSSGSASC